jgi:hypothetical protein
MPEITKISDLITDVGNANKGTERGDQALENSLQDYGAGRSILIDKHGNVIAGNKTLEKAGAVGIEDIYVVQTDGKTLVAVQRMDLDLNDGPEARELAYADNRVGQLSLDWDVEQMFADHEADIAIPFFTPLELAAMLDIDEKEYDESIADGLELKGRFIIECPINNADNVELRLKELFKDNDDIIVLRSETV